MNLRQQITSKWQWNGSRTAVSDAASDNVCSQMVPASELNEFLYDSGIAPDEFAESFLKSDVAIDFAAEIARPTITTQRQILLWISATQLAFGSMWLAGGDRIAADDHGNAQFDDSGATRIVKGKTPLELFQAALGCSRADALEVLAQKAKSILFEIVGAERMLKDAALMHLAGESCRVPQ